MFLMNPDKLTFQLCLIRKRPRVEANRLALRLIMDTGVKSGTPEFNELWQQWIDIRHA